MGPVVPTPEPSPSSMAMPVCQDMQALNARFGRWETDLGSLLQTDINVAQSFNPEGFEAVIAKGQALHIQTCQTAWALN